MYLSHEPLGDVRTDESSASANADFDDAISTDFFRMLRFEIGCECVSHFADL